MKPVFKLFFAVFLLFSSGLTLPMKNSHKQGKSEFVQYELDDELINLVYQKDSAAVGQLIERGANIDMPVKSWDESIRHATFLILAARDRDEEQCILLLKHGANVNAQCSRGWSALHYALSDGEWDLCKLLLAHGARVDIQDNEGNTPLLRMYRYFNKEVFDLLLAHGAQLNAENNDGRSFLSNHVIQGNLNVCAYALKNGADLHVVDNQGHSLLDQVSYAPFARQKMLRGLLTGLTQFSNQLIALVEKKKLEELQHFLNKYSDYARRGRD